MWTSEIPSLLSGDNVERMREALRRGLVCGLHAFYAGGGGPEACAFSEFDHYLDTVLRSRPGDWFTLWSVADLSAQNLLLCEAHGAPPSSDRLKAVENFLNEDPRREYMAVGRVAAGNPPEIAYGDIDSFADLALLAGHCGPGGELYVLPLSSLEAYGPDGRYYGIHCVVDAKRPNERGEVPLGGPY